MQCVLINNDKVTDNGWMARGNICRVFTFS